MNQSNQSGYILQERVFKNNGTSVSYPIIISGDNKEKVDSLNDIILGDINKILSIYSADAFLPHTEGPDVFLLDTLRIRYDIMRNDNNYLSIFYTADFYSPYAAYPTQAVYTTNIDVQKARRIKLADIIDVDDNFINDFLLWKPVDINPMYIQGIRDYILGLGLETIRRGFSFSDIIGPENFLGIFSYLKPDKIGISISMPIYLGNHAEYERTYEITI